MASIAPEAGSEFFTMKHLPLSRSQEQLRDSNQQLSNWKWSEREGWNMAPDCWQEFNSNWSSATTQWPDKTIDGKLLLSHPEGLSENQTRTLIIREEYKTLFEQVYYTGLQCPRSGALITEQPGVGKSCFQYYLLARLLQQGQVVLISLDGVNIFLFYFDKVYAASMTNSELVQYPSGSTKNLLSIWSLVDTDTGNSEPCPGLLNNKFLVQSAPPDPARYKCWTKQKDAVVFGMKIWTREEIYLALQYETEYPTLVEELTDAYGQTSRPATVIDKHMMTETIMPQSPFLGDSPEGRIRTYLQVANFLYRVRTSRSSCSNDEEFTVETAISSLLDEAIYHFGYVARDVLAGVFRLESQSLYHKEALVSQSLDSLHDIVNSIRGGRALSPSSHRLIVQRPIPPTSHLDLLMRVQWSCHFKSAWIMQQLFEKLIKVQDMEVHAGNYFIFNQTYREESMNRSLEPLLREFSMKAINGGLGISS
ncbi:Crinkler effector [Abortiporus biennis]